MRIDLVTSFAEKEEAKALGARWDAAKKIGTSLTLKSSHRFCVGFPKLEKHLKDVSERKVTY